MNELLARAEQILSGEVAVPAHSARAACWLARAALEEAVRDLLLARRLDPGAASMRTRLSCLESACMATDSAAVRQAAYAWAALSDATHHHAFELSPTLSEARHLVDLVTKLSAGVGPS